MTTAAKSKPTQWDELRKPFPPELIGTIPKGGVNLSYVGHAAVTDRLLQVDPEWTWEPMGVDEHGRPLVVENDGGMPGESLGLWIRLTVCGVTRPGFGGGKNAKECISDAIRNAAMRFGVALDLWAKEDLTGATFKDDPKPEPEQFPNPTQNGAGATETQQKKLLAIAKRLIDKAQIEARQVAMACGKELPEGAPFDKLPPIFAQLSKSAATDLIGRLETFEKNVLTA